MADLSSVRRLAALLPGVEEGTSYGTPAWRVRGKFFARMREDGETLVVKVEPEEKPLLMASEPDVFYETDHYRGHALVLVRLPAIDEDELAEVVEDAWRRAAPKRLLRERDEAG